MPVIHNTHTCNVFWKILPLQGTYSFNEQVRYPTAKVTTPSEPDL